MEPRMDGARRAAAPGLRPYVAWYSGYRQEGLPPGVHRGLPSPHLTLILTLDDPLTIAAHSDPAHKPGEYRALIAGLHVRPVLIRHEGYQSGVQVALHPLGARALLGLPAGELAGADVDLDQVLGHHAALLREQLIAAPTWADRFDVLDAVLARRLDPDPSLAPELDRAWRLLRADGGVIGVRRLARDVGWGERHLLHRFRQEIGLAPKAAARVVRFDRARLRLLRRVTAGRPAELAALAAGAGYFDQAHLAREFRELAGCSPRRFLAEELRYVQADHLRDDADWPA